MQRLVIIFVFRRFLRAAQASYKVMQLIYFTQQPIFFLTSLFNLEKDFISHTSSNLQSPSYELEYLADYLAELTLIDYNFLNFLPSVIAASAVFLARWTLDQTIHPWVCIVLSIIYPARQVSMCCISNLTFCNNFFFQNSTLEHYTSYKSSDIKTTVFALQDLQLNTNGCPLRAISMKYRQEKV